MKKKKGFLFSLMAFVAVVVVLALILMIPPVSNYVSKVTGVASEKLRSVAATIVGTGAGVLLVGWGIAALSMPILGGAMIVIGLALLAYSLWPLFSPRSSSNDLGKTGLQKVA